MISRLRDHVSYSSVVATLALFIGLGGTSFAVLQIDSKNVVDNSLRSRDIRNSTVRGRDVRDRTLRARDIGRDKLGSGVINEATLNVVPRASNADRLGGATAQELRLRCPTDTLARAGVCIESTARQANGFLGALNICGQAGRGLPSMSQLDVFLRAGNLSPEMEWTANVYRNPANGSNPFEQLETVLLNGRGEISYERVYLAVQHAFRCVALPSN